MDHVDGSHNEGPRSNTIGEIEAHVQVAPGRRHALHHTDDVAVLVCDQQVARWVDCYTNRTGMRGAGSRTAIS